MRDFDPFRGVFIPNATHYQLNINLSLTNVDLGIPNILVLGL